MTYVISRSRPTDVLNRYGTQLDILLVLWRLAEHFASAAVSMAASRSFHGVRIVVPAAIATIADAVLRIHASDIPSAVSEHLTGEVHDHPPFGVSFDLFARQAETIEV